MKGTNRILGIIEGSKKLKEILQEDKILETEVCTEPEEFNPEAFTTLPKKGIWAVNVVGERRPLFTKEEEEVISLMKSHPRKNYVIRRSPPYEDISYYGTFLIDKKSFNNTIVSNISSKEKQEIIEYENYNGVTFKTNPRELDSDVQLRIRKEKVDYSGDYKVYSDIKPCVREIVRDTSLIKTFFEQRGKGNLVIPGIFIINKFKDINYVGIGMG